MSLKPVLQKSWLLLMDFKSKGKTLGKNTCKAGIQDEEILC
jgi:hypothetical protein